MKLITSILTLCAILYLTLLTVETTTGTHSLFQAYTLLGVGALCLVVFCTRRVRIRFNLVDALLFAFAFYVLVNYLFMSSVPAYSKAVQWLFMFMLYLVLRIVLVGKLQRKYTLLLLLAVCGIYHAAIGLLQVVDVLPSNHAKYIITGTFFNPGPYSGYVVTIASVCFVYFMRSYNALSYAFEQRRYKRLLHLWAILSIVSALCALLSMLVLPATLSRAAVVALFVVAVALLIKHKQWKPLFISLFAIAVVGVGLYFFKQGSADGRVLMFLVSCAIIANNPLGVGFGGFQQAYAKQQALYFQEAEHATFLSVAGCPEYAFNEYMHIAVELGLIGLVLFVALAVVSLWNLFKKNSIYTYGLLALLVFACFSYPFSLLPFQVLLIVFVALAANSTKAVIKYSFKHQFAFAAILSLCIYAVYSMLPSMKTKVQALQEYKTLSYMYSGEYFEGANNDYKPLLEPLKDNAAYLFNYGQALNKLGEHNLSNAILRQGTLISSDPMFYNLIGNNYKALGAYTEAEEAYNTAFAMLPNRMYPLYLLMQLYQKHNQHDKATTIANKILNIKPKVVSPATDEMQEKAEEVIQKYSNSV